MTHKIAFAYRGLRAEGIQPVGIRFAKDDHIAFVALGPANRVAVVDTKTYKVTQVPAGRAACMADGVHP